VTKSPLVEPNNQTADNETNLI